MTDISRTLGKHKKRNVSVMAIPLSSTELSAGTFEVGILPTNILIIGASVTNIVAFSAATSVELELKGGATLVTAADLAADADTVVDSATTPIAVQTGPTVDVVVTGGVALTAGEAVATIEYIEYTQCTGELTNFLPDPNA